MLETLLTSNLREAHVRIACILFLLSLSPWSFLRKFLGIASCAHFQSRGISTVNLQFSFLVPWISCLTLGTGIYRRWLVELSLLVIQIQVSHFQPSLEQFRFRELHIKCSLPSKAKMESQQPSFHWKPLAHRTQLAAMPNLATICSVA